MLNKNTWLLYTKIINIMPFIYSNNSPLKNILKVYFNLFKRYYFSPYNSCFYTNKTTNGVRCKKDHIFKHIKNLFNLLNLV